MTEQSLDPSELEDFYSSGASNQELLTARTLIAIQQGRPLTEAQQREAERWYAECQRWRKACLWLVILGVLFAVAFFGGEASPPTP